MENGPFKKKYSKELQQNNLWLAFQKVLTFYII